MDHQLRGEEAEGGDENPNQEVNRIRPREVVIGQQPATQSCPRCNSNNTKFCYYNNYSLAQPRYFCKNCRRHWTLGGVLRNIPIGGGSRKSKCLKLSSSSSVHASASTSQSPVPSVQPNNTPFYGIITVGGIGGLLSSLSLIQEPGFGSNLGLLHGLGLPSTMTAEQRPNQEVQQSFQQLVHQQRQNIYAIGTTMETGATSSSSGYNWNLSSNNNNNKQNDQCDDFLKDSGLDHPF